MNAILDKEPVKRAEKSIKEFDQNLEIICLKQTARTALDASTALGCSVGAIVKSLLFSAGNSFVLCLVSGDKRCSLNKLKKILKLAKDYELNSSLDQTIKNAKPPIFWKEKEIVKEQINSWSKSDISILIEEVHKLEIKFKKNNNLSNNLIYDFMLNTTGITNN